MYISTLLAFAVLGAAPLASAHCLISAATGNLGGNGTGLGVVAGGVNSQADVTVFKSTAGKFGATASGNIVPATALAAMIKLTGATIPQVSSTGGIVSMTLHQLNADGAGPMACSISADATGNTFTVMQITTQVPGTNGRSTVSNTDFALVADIPAGTACTGTVGTTTNVCLVKCQNPAGPFGGVVPVQMVAAKKVRAVEFEA